MINIVTNVLKSILLVYHISGIVDSNRYIIFSPEYKGKFSLRIILLYISYYISGKLCTPVSIQGGTPKFAKNFKKA